MKVTRLPDLIEFLVVCLISILGFSSPGQIVSGPISYIPTVTIRATDPLANWAGNPGLFTVYRSGNPQPALNIYYRIGGTATEGADYQPIGNFVQIPSGVMAANIVIQPINQGQTGDKSVALTLARSPLMSPLTPGSYTDYIIGPASNATVVITSRPLTNIPPLVNVTFPTDDAVFYTPVKLPLMACAYDPDGLVTQVEFFANGTRLGVATTSPTILPPTPTPLTVLPPLPPYRPFVFTWTNVPPTNVVLTAKATDNSGATTLSAPVTFTVRPGPPPPPPLTNLVVRITSPANGATFRAPVNLPIYAYAADVVSTSAGSADSVTGVEFFAGATDLGPGQRVTPPLVPGAAVPSPTRLGNLWMFVWTNAPQGTFALSAVATDAGGATATSAAVNVNILPPPPPPPPPLTNLVRIIAADPIAIEGTNCWPWLGLAAATPSWTNWTATSAVCRYFTNCGPKNAVFVVQRLGDTNADLSVAYDLAGTATNGVDYVTLPGSVTIPAGQRSALITVVPLDDGAPDITSTVILKLKPANDYRLGLPASAAAIILDGARPQPISGVLPDKTFHLRATGPDGAWFHIESTVDLLHWTPVCTNQVIQGSIDFIDPEAQANQVRFYRAVPEAAAP